MGGGTLSSYDLYNGLSQKHHVTLLFPFSENNVAYEEALKRGINAQQIDAKPLTFEYYNGGPTLAKSVLKYILRKKNIKYWIEYIIELNPDIVILNSLVLSPMIKYIKRNAKTNKIKVVCFIRETMKGTCTNTVNRLITNRLVKADGVSFLSKHDKDEWHLTIANQVIIPEIVYGHDDYHKDSLLARKQLDLNSNYFYVLYVGGSSLIKGSHIIIKAMAEIRKKGFTDIRLLYLGNSTPHKSNSLNNKLRNHHRNKYIRYVNSLIDELNLNNFINIEGVQSDMKSWYTAADVVVFPAIKAHQARPIFESGVFSRPVIATDFSNYDDFLINNENGFVFKRGDYKDLADKIIFLAKNHEICRSMGHKNYMFSQIHNSSNVYFFLDDFINKLT